MWEELYERYRGELVRYAARLCGSGEEAEDLVQEVFLRALQNAAQESSWTPKSEHS